MVLVSPSHPWINFEFDLANVAPFTWVLLGEAMSKCEHMVGSPLRPVVADELSKVYLARGVHATTAIEGNTLTEDEVLARVRGDKQLPSSREYLGVEIDNIIAAIEEIDVLTRAGLELPLDTPRLLHLHAQVLDGLEDPPGTNPRENDPGRLRRHNVGVARYRAPDHSEVEQLLDRLFEWLHRLEVPADSRSADRFNSAVLRAILAHLYIAWIHPFGNGNGRTARLVEVQILTQSGLVPLVSTNLLSDYYNKTRELYYKHLDRASRSRDATGFVGYAIQGFVEELREQIRVVKEHNERIAWESYIHEVMNGYPSSEAKSRQRRVALAMPWDRYLTRDEVEHLSPQIAADYAVRNERRPVRDLNDLARMGLLDKKDNRYRARIEIIRAFQPPVAGQGLLDEPPIEGQQSSDQRPEAVQTTLNV